MTAIAPKKRGRKRAKKLSDYDDSESDVFQKSDDVQSKKSKCGKKKPKYDDLFDPDLLYNSFDSDVESVASELKGRFHVFVWKLHNCRVRTFL